MRDLSSSSSRKKAGSAPSQGANSPSVAAHRKQRTSNPVSSALLCGRAKTQRSKPRPRGRDQMSGSARLSLLLRLSFLSKWGGRAPVSFEQRRGRSFPRLVGSRPTGRRSLRPSFFRAKTRKELSPASQKLSSPDRICKRPKPRTCAISRPPRRCFPNPGIKKSNFFQKRLDFSLRM